MDGLEKGFTLITAYGIFIVMFAALIFAFYLLNRHIEENYNRFDEPPFFLKKGYQTAAFISVTWYFLIPVFKAHAAVNKLPFESDLPWYGGGLFLTIISIVITGCSFFIAYYYHRDD